MRKKKSSIVIKLFVFLLIMCGLAFAGYYYGNQYIQTYETKITGLENQLLANQKTTYVATTDIAFGEEISLDTNVECRNVVSGLDDFMYIGDSDIGKTAIIDIPADSPIMYSMVSDMTIADDTREYEFSAVSLATTQTNNDIIDIRIVFPTGQDYIVVSKKQIQNLNGETNTFTAMLSEEEILRYRSACNDVYTISGTKMYTSKYVEPSLQSDATPYYPVNTYTLNILASDPNRLGSPAEYTVDITARAELEKNLLTLSEDYLGAVANGNAVTDNSNSQVLLANPALEESTESGSIIMNEDGTYESVEQDVAQ